MSYLTKEYIYQDTYGNNTPTKAHEFIKWLDGLIEKVPVEFRDKVEIGISARNEYGDAVREIDIYYYRPETEKEIEYRERQLEHSRNFDIARAKRILADNGIIVP